MQPGLASTKVLTIYALLCLSILACAEGAGPTATTGGPQQQDAGPDSGMNPGTCTYPALDAGVLPDVGLGLGYINWDGAKNPAVYPSGDGGVAASMSSAAGVFEWLHCSSFRYLLLDLTTNYCPGSLAFAQVAPQKVDEWLDAGGTVLSVMEQSGTASTVTAVDLEQWSYRWGLNYTLVTDPTQGLTSFLDVRAWPSAAFVDLRTMRVLWFIEGSGAEVADQFSVLLDAGTLPGPG